MSQQPKMKFSNHSPTQGVVCVSWGQVVQHEGALTLVSSPAKQRQTVWRLIGSFGLLCAKMISMMNSLYNGDWWARWRDALGFGDDCRMWDSICGRMHLRYVCHSKEGEFLATVTSVVPCVFVTKWLNCGVPTAMGMWYASLILTWWGCVAGGRVVCVLCMAVLRTVLLDWIDLCWLMLCACVCVWMCLWCMFFVLCVCELCVCECVCVCVCLLVCVCACMCMHMCVKMVFRRLCVNMCIWVPGMYMFYRCVFLSPAELSYDLICWLELLCLTLFLWPSIRMYSFHQFCVYWVHSVGRMWKNKHKLLHGTKRYKCDFKKA